MNANIDMPKRAIATFCQHHRIRCLALFGSVRRVDMLLHARKAVDAFGRVRREDLEDDWIKELALTRTVEAIVGKGS